MEAHSAPRVPINGLDSGFRSRNLQLASSHSYRYRTARFYKVFDQPPPSIPSSASGPAVRPEGIDNPLVIASLTAGLAGVTIIIIIILSIWILKRTKALPSHEGVKHSIIRSHAANEVRIQVEPDESQEEEDSVLSANSSVSLNLDQEEFHQEHLTLVISVPKETAV